VQSTSDEIFWQFCKTRHIFARALFPFACVFQGRIRRPAGRLGRCRASGVRRAPPRHMQAVSRLLASAARPRWRRS
jgi:hypothetical protein